MKRRLLNLLTALSLLLCVAMTSLWVRSYFRGDAVSFAAGPPPPAVSSEWFVRSNYGVLYFARNDSFGQGFGFDPRPLSWQSHPADRDFCGPAVQSGGPGFVAGPFSLGSINSATLRHTGATIPHWFFATAAATAPVLRTTRDLSKRRRRGLTLCRRCGYDLRATPQRCPECGTPPPDTTSRPVGPETLTPIKENV